MDQLVQQYIRSMKLTAGLNTQRVFAAWDACSGAQAYTLKRFFRGGKLYITLASSVIRSQLYFQRDVLVEKMNAFLAEDSLFSGEDPSTGYVKELILK
jgi:hypothetical protein